MFAHLIIYVLLFLQSEGRANRPGGGPVCGRPARRSAACLPPGTNKQSVAIGTDVNNT